MADLPKKPALPSPTVAESAAQDPERATEGPPAAPGMEHRASPDAEKKPGENHLSPAPANDERSASGRPQKSPIETVDLPEAAPEPVAEPTPSYFPDAPAN